MSRKRKRALPQRRLRMKRPQRLQAARRWLEAQTGRTPDRVAKSYRKWFAVDWHCAIQELEMLGLHFDSKWVAQLNRSLEGAQQARRRRIEEREAEAAEDDCDSDYYFAYIAGYTSGGAAYGITREEWRQLEAEEGQSQEPECPF